ncbi:unnamed protein product [Leptosia nina]|uniref:THAP-type domain-containing protein n=1 Tax=Leptosia nina TaxID=320188 RepID=A0AAV1K1M2_9NEOP
MMKKPPGVLFHGCPTSTEMRNKWLRALRHKCLILDWNKSKICSKHFDNECFDGNRKLKTDAVPTIFPSSMKHPQITKRNDPQIRTYGPKNRIDRLLSKKSQSELILDIKNSISKMREPRNLDNMVTEDLKFRGEVSNEAQLWLIVKKQEHLSTRSQRLIDQQRKQIDLLQNAVENKTNKKEIDETDTNKYIIKCLQEKLTTLEEQIEILTAVEAR